MGRLLRKPIDLNVLNRIKAEAFQRSQVMDHLFYLTDVYGPRLTDSPGFRQAGDWAVKRLEGYGFQNVKLEKWGLFGHSWKLGHFSAHLIAPQYKPLIGVPLTWTPGTKGVVTGEPIMAVIASRSARFWLYARPHGAFDTYPALQHGPFDRVPGWSVSTPVIVRNAGVSPTDTPVAALFIKRYINLATFHRSNVLSPNS